MSERFSLKSLTPIQTSGVLLLLTLALFITFSKAAYQSYFSDDDFSNLALARFVPWLSLPKAMFSLGYENNIRPFGILYYKILGATAHFNFIPYLAVLQVIHVATSLSLWIFLRRLPLRPLAAGLGCLFFAVNVATLTAYWKPMYVFDVLCGFWTILSLLCYQRNKFLLSFLCAWLAFRSKEMELMLPLVLLAYEWWFGQKRDGRWLPLIPFFLMSLLFGLQAVMQSTGPETAYSMHLTPASLWTSLVYYGGKVLYAPLAGIFISLGLFFVPKRVVRFGVIGFWILLFPMLLFPGRQSGAYLYVPLLGFAVAMAGTFDWKPTWAAIFFLIWFPASYNELRLERNPIIAFGHEHRPYVTQVREALMARPSATAVVFDGTPVDFAIWGQEGLFGYVLDKYDLLIRDASSPDALEILRRPEALLLTWDRFNHRLIVNTYPGDGHEAASVDFARDNPFWQLKDGWKFLIKGCRWTAPHAMLALRQPQGASVFALNVKASPNQTIRVSSAGRAIGQQLFTTSGLQSIRWPVSSPRPELKDVEITVDPPVHPSPDSEPYGALVCACGFVNP